MAEDIKGRDLSNYPVQFLTSARVMGQPGAVTTGYGTELSLNSGCEDWKVPSDHRGADFEDW